MNEADSEVHGFVIVKEDDVTKCHNVEFFVEGELGTGDNYYLCVDRYKLLKLLIDPIDKTINVVFIDNFEARYDLLYKYRLVSCTQIQCPGYYYHKIEVNVGDKGRFLMDFEAKGPL